MNALVPVNHAPDMSVTDVEKIATAIAKGGLFGSKDPMAVLTLCLLAQAEGQHPAVVFRDYDIIQGKPSKKAKAMLSDFLAGGGKVKWNRLDDEVADATFSHPAGGEVTINWNMARANKAGLGGKDMWKKYPRQMLRSRCISEGVSTVFPGATSGLYVPEEVMDFDEKPNGDNPQTGEVIEAQAEKIPGIHKIKDQLRKMMDLGNSEDITLEGFHQLKRSYRADLKTIRDANHTWWTGDEEDFEGFGPWIARREAELSNDDGTFKMMLDSMTSCQTKMALESWMIANEAMVGELDGVESRKFQLAYEAHEGAIQQMDTAVS